ncbi:MAG: PPC domain-containing protein [Candidatus Hydrogenedentota bacterium]
MRIFFFTALLIGTQIAYAVNPALSTVMPRGGQRGTDVEVTFHGSNLTDAVDVFFHDEGISVKEVKEAAGGTFKCILSVSPEAQLGNHRVRVRTKTGISGLVFFSVGNLTEIAETEPNSQPEQAQKIGLNSTVNGTITSEDVDYFAIDLEADSRLAVEVEALRLGQELFDVKARLFSPGGHELVAEDDTALVRQDAAFVYEVHEAGTYVIALSESTYGGNGNYHYRTHIGNFPRPLAMTPMGMQIGTKVNVNWLGDPGISTQSVEMKDVLIGASSVMPANDLGLAPSAVPFRVSEFAGILEVEPNNANEQASHGAVPGAFDGVIQEDGDIDKFSFDGKKGQVFDARVWAREMGSQLDSVMSIHAPGGGQVMSNDDGKGLDSYGRITLPEDGKYTITIYDQLKRGGEAFAYRVELTPIKPKLTISQRLNEQALITVAKGNRAALYLGITRSDFDSPVQLLFENLPEGVEVTYTEVPNGQTQLPILLTASSEAPLVGSRLGVNATGKKGEETINGSLYQSQPVVFGRNKTVIMDTKLRVLAMATVDHVPFKIDIIPAKTPVIRGSSKDLKVVVTRDEGFTKPIQMTVPMYPSGLNGGTLTIPEGASEAIFTVESKSNAPLGELKIIAVATSEGYSVATQFVPIQIEDKWLNLEVGELRLEQGTEVSVSVKVTLAKEFDGEFDVRMYRLPKGVSAPDQKITKASTEVTFPLTIAADAPEGKHGTFAFAIDITKEGEVLRHRYAGKPLTIFKPLPPAVKKAAAPKPVEPAKPGEPPKPKRRTRFPETQK